MKIPPKILIVYFLLKTNYQQLWYHSAHSHEAKQQRLCSLCHWVGPHGHLSFLPWRRAQAMGWDGPSLHSQKLRGLTWYLPS